MYELNARIIYVADYMDASYICHEGTKEIFYGKLTNHTKTLSKDDCKTKGVFDKIYFFPWKNIEEEFATVSAKQFPYQNCTEISNTAKTKRKFKM